MPEPTAELFRLRAKIPVVLMNDCRNSEGDGVAHQSAAVAAGGSEAVGSPTLSPFFWAIDPLTNGRARGYAKRRDRRKRLRSVIIESLFWSDGTPWFWRGLRQQFQESRSVFCVRCGILGGAGAFCNEND